MFRGNNQQTCKRFFLFTPHKRKTHIQILSALCHFTCMAVFCTSSNSPSKLASSSSANGSKLTRRVNFVFTPDSLSAERCRRGTSPFCNAFVFSTSLLTDELADLSVSSMLLLLLLVIDDLFSIRATDGIRLSSIAFVLTFSNSGNNNSDGISMRRDVYWIGLMPDICDRKRGCSDSGCFLMVNGLALIGKLSMFGVLPLLTIDCWLKSAYSFSLAPMIVGILELRILVLLNIPLLDPLDWGDDSVLLFESEPLFGFGGNAGRDLSNNSDKPLIVAVSLWL